MTLNAIKSRNNLIHLTLLMLSVIFAYSPVFAQHQSFARLNHSAAGESAHIDDMSSSHEESMQYHISDDVDSRSDSAGSEHASMHEMESMESGESHCACAKCKGVCTDPGHPEKPLRTMPGDRDQGDCPPLRYQMSDCERSGSPHCYHRWAKCAVTSKYSVGVVGGGAAFWRGRPRTTQEGTWGLDYDGLFGHVNNWLDYTRCRNQGGEGAYETVGGPEPFGFLHHE